VTLIVAHVSPSGAVMAADSHVTEEDNTAGFADKIWMCGGLLFGYSGSMSVRDRLQLAIEQGLDGAPMPSRSSRAARAVDGSTMRVTAR
jgi:hypothetical protein